MQKGIFIGMFALMLSQTACGQQNDVESVKAAIHAFGQASEKSDVAALDKYLDDNFRVVMNRLFGSEKVSLLPKSAYLDKIRSKEFGGKKREIQINELVLNGTSASTKVTFSGSDMTFVSLITLIKNEAGQWKLVSDVPTFP